MRSRGWWAGAVALGMIVGLAGCGASGTDRADTEGAARTSEERTVVGEDVVAPVTRDVSDLAGESVELVVGQALVIDTAETDVASYRADLSDPSVATFAPGHRDAGAEFSPGVTAVSAGSTEVTLTHEQGGVEPVQFEVTVVPRG